MSRPATARILSPDFYEIATDIVVFCHNIKKHDIFGQAKELPLHLGIIKQLKEKVAQIVLDEYHSDYADHCREIIAYENDIVSCEANLEHRYEKVQKAVKHTVKHACNHAFGSDFIQDEVAVKEFIDVILSDEPVKSAIMIKGLNKLSQAAETRINELKIMLQHEQIDREKLKMSVKIDDYQALIDRIEHRLMQEELDKMSFVFPPQAAVARDADATPLPQNDSTSPSQKTPTATGDAVSLPEAGPLSLPRFLNKNEKTI